MRKLKEIWLGLDIINRIILISGILACIWFVVKGRGLYGAALVVLMGMLMVSRKNNREKRLSRLYGGFHFHMPDGEIVPAGKAYFYIGNVTELRRSSEKEGFPGGES